jgi:hypothetical protein
MIKTITPNKRFSDKGQMLYDFGDEFLVVCPKCSSPGKVVIDRAEVRKIPRTESEKYTYQLFAPRKFYCLHCLHRKTWKGHQIRVGDKTDWYFQYPLQLQIECCGQTLWAYNEKHLEFIKNYVEAKLRARTPNINRSLVSRLPERIKSARNRERILRAIEILKGELNGES